MGAMSLRSYPYPCPPGTLSLMRHRRTLCRLCQFSPMAWLTAAELQGRLMSDPAALHIISGASMGRTVLLYQKEPGWFLILDNRVKSQNKIIHLPMLWTTCCRQHIKATKWKQDYSFSMWKQHLSWSKCKVILTAAERTANSLNVLIRNWC